MHFLISLLLFHLLGAAWALESPHRKAVRSLPKRFKASKHASPVTAKDSGDRGYLTHKTEKFLVDTIPDVEFDVGESYAGLLPNTPAGNSSLFFWFFPSQNPKAKDEITIWLNGGPGCSSMDGLLQENGPFLWQSGTYRPIRNPYSWTKLTNMVYVDQPAGTGFSPGPSTVSDELDVAAQFKSWFKNFVDTFDLHGRKVYIIGESYAGQYIPYIASGMLDEEDSTYFNVRGIQINDPAINDYSIMINVPAVQHLNSYLNVFALNDSFVESINKRAERCGFHQFLDEALTYPPPTPFPVAPDSSEDDCALWEEVVRAAYYVNPCFNFYHITDFCPYLWDEMGFPSLAGGPDNYFNSVIERTNNTIIGHGWLDYLIFVNGSLVTIQNMTWNGAQGFQKPPTEPLFVPYHYGLAELGERPQPAPFTLDAGAGYLGTAHTERGLTFSTVYLAGHEIPQYTPGAAFRQLEFLLGRIDSLSREGSYTA